MRRAIKRRPPVSPDRIYNSTKIEKFINYVMERGKKDTANKIIYKTFDYIKEKEPTKKPLDVFEDAIKNSSPLMEVRSRRIGGANYQVPREVRPERRLSLSMRWIIDAAKSKKGSAMYKKLGDEIILASKGEGEAVKKRENTHKMAESNKAFAHFSW